MNRTAYDDAAIRVFAAAKDLGRYAFDLHVLTVHLHPAHWSRIIQDSLNADVTAASHVTRDLKTGQPRFLGIRVYPDIAVRRGQITVRAEVTV